MYIEKVYYNNSTLNNITSNTNSLLNPKYGKKFIFES